MVLNDTDPPPVVPVAVALQHDQLQGNIPVISAHARPSLAVATLSHSSSVVRLPGSRTNGKFVTVNKSQIQKLLVQGYMRGHAAILAQTIQSFPLRICVVDNSRSMQKTHGYRFTKLLELSKIKVVKCTQWRELKDCVKYHARMAAALEAPTTLCMLNNPGCSPNSKQFG
jgi:hypothetical protein